MTDIQQHAVSQRGAHGGQQFGGFGGDLDDAGLVQRLRGEDLFKKPGVAETIDWAKCLLALDVIALSPEVIADTLGAILKYQDDIQKIQGSEAKRLLDEVRQTMTVA